MTNRASSSNAPILREERDVPPAHFLFNVKQYSVIPNQSGTRYDSCSFDASGSKWKLILYPYGDKSRPGNDYISLFLELLNPGTDNSSVSVDLKFFVHNHRTGKYSTIRGVKTFNKDSTVHGFSQLLSLENFKNSGYLHNDCCAFGVEVFKIKPASRSPEQTLTLFRQSGSPQSYIVIKGPTANTYSWEIKSFKDFGASRITKQFEDRGIKWELYIDPKGYNLDNIRNKYLSLFLLPKSTTGKVRMTAELAVIDHKGTKNVRKTRSYEFEAQPKTSSGYRDFMLLSDLHATSNGYLKDGNLIVQVRFDNISS